MQLTDDITPLIEPLNPAQREAVTAPSSDLLVLAGAGSGKTRVLVHRIAWLIQVERVSAQSILAVTFTNKAAGEMRSRIEALIDVPVRAMWVGTFHGLAHRLLRLHWQEAKLPQNFQILDSDDQYRLIRRVLKALEMDETRWPPRQLQWFINAQKDEGRRPQHIQDSGDFAQAQMLRVYKAYEEACQRAGVVDFAELLLRAHELCRDNAALLAHYRRRFRHLLVDEFQDTNTLQYAWIRLIAGQGPEQSANVFVVGDDDQCVVKGTPIRMADGSEKPIEDIRPGDVVLSCYGRGDFRAATVARVFRKRREGPLITLHTNCGLKLTSTPEHTHFAGYRLGDSPQTSFTYLMHKRGVGFRLGVSQVYTKGQRKPMVGFKQRVLQEHADAVWVVGTHESANEARIDEIQLSLSYGIPTLPFTARKGKAMNGYVHDPALIARVFSSLDTESAGRRLLHDRGLDPEEPHHRPRSRNSSRNNVVVTLCQDRRGRKSLHRVSIVGNSSAARAQLASIGFTTRPAKPGSRSWRFDACRADFGELLKIAHEARHALDGTLVLSANLNGRSLPFVRAGSVRPGMAITLGDGSTDSVSRIERRDAGTEVFDLNVSGTHNYIAGGIVTHNSIYSWRGAKVDNIIRFAKDFPGAQTVRLEQNYRSTGTILKAANGLISHNTSRLGKELWTDGGAGEPIHLYAAFNEGDEAGYVLGRIQDWISGGGRRDEIAILYRSNAQSRVFEEQLVRLGIPYRVYGGLRFFERLEIKDALAYLRLLASRDDDAAFERVINTPTRGIGNTTVDRLREIARAEGISLWRAAEKTVTGGGRSAGALQAFIELINRMAAATQDLTLAERVQHVVEQSGLIPHYRKEKGEAGEARVENLEELANAARGFDYEEIAGNTEEALAAEIDPLTAFLTHAALESGENQGEAGSDCVQLMTLHSAKGLEFPLVFMVGLEEGLFPHQRSVEDAGGLEEERRLCYVGMTRAMRRLHLSHAETRRLHGAENLCTPSRFLREIPSECVQEVRPHIRIARPVHHPASAGQWKNPRNDRVAGFKLGQRVMHQTFGEGVVLRFEGDGDRARIQVNFNDAGSKWLVVGYAKLQPL